MPGRYWTTFVSFQERMKFAQAAPWLTARAQDTSGRDMISSVVFRMRATRLLGVPAIRHEEVAEGRDRIQEIVFSLVGAEVPFLEAAEALVGRDLSIGLEADILERIRGAFARAREEVVGAYAKLPEMTSGDACLGMAAFGQRRVAPALVLVVDIEERLAVPHEIERLHGLFLPLAL